ncbi:MAG TPA: chloride channel protein [Pseudonocardiaceae bacterium]|nr:chloride channel protein [Pseudonocardiaceae bacterium]
MAAPVRREAGARYLRLVLLAALIGVPAAFLAAVFLAAVNWLQRALWTDLPHAIGASTPPWYLVLGLPVVGAGIVVAARTLLPGDGGHPPLGGLDMTPTPVRNGPGVALAAIGALGFGAVLGPEGPLIALGSVVGMAVTPLVRGDERGKAVLATAGSFASISALFGGPVVAGMLLVEAGVGEGAALIPALLPGLVAAALGYVIFIGFGTWGGLPAASLHVPDLPVYQGLHLTDLLVAIGVGLVAGVVIEGVRVLGKRIEGVPLGLPYLLLAGGLVVGGLALLARALGADSQDLLFSGQAGVPAIVSQSSLTVVLVLLIGKALAYAVCLGCGFRGGPVFPAIFIGIGVAALAEHAFGTSPTLTVAVGAAAGMAGMTRLLFAPILFALLLVGMDGVAAVPAAVLAGVASWLLTTALRRESTEDGEKE